MTVEAGPDQTLVPPAPNPTLEATRKAHAREKLINQLLIGAFLALLAAWIVPDINWRLVDRYYARFFEGALVTLQLVVLSVGLGAVLSLPFAFARLSASKLLRGAALTYITFFRGTPLIAQLFLVYYGAGQFSEQLQAAGLWWFFREPFLVAILTFTLNTAAYQAEIMRGAIQAIPAGQREAGSALGLSRGATMLKVVLPQAYLIALRPLGNELILMIKASALASVVTVFDLMGMTSLAYGRSFNFQVFFWAALMYLILVEMVRRIWMVIEARLTRHLQRIED